MSPGVASELGLVTSTEAGVRSGRDWKLSRSPGTLGAGGNGIDGTGPDGVATVKRNVPALAPRMCWSVLTVTSSPGRNGRDGRKLPPRPSESAMTRPACRPLRDPVTITLPRRTAGIPGKTICVPGEATRPPGIGKVRTSGSAEPQLVTRHTPISARAQPAMEANPLLHLIHRGASEVVRPANDRPGRGGRARKPSPNNQSAIPR